MYGQVTDVSGLRQLETGFNSHVTHHYHLGMGIKRPTLSDANRECKDVVFA
jgi:hypothetical protein